MAKVRRRLADAGHAEPRRLVSNPASCSLRLRQGQHEEHGAIRGPRGMDAKAERQLERVIG